jgi:hypothetical protein
MAFLSGVHFLTGRHCKFRLNTAGKITSDDIAQGQLGDCWMMTAMASMAQYPGAVSNLFVTKEYNDRGKYSVRLYSPFLKKYVTLNTVTVTRTLTLTLTLALNPTMKESNGKGVLYSPFKKNQTPT